MKTVLHVVGARPNFMKIAPVMAALRVRADVRQVLVHTGQHYDDQMAKVFFDELSLPRPDHNLGVGSGTHAEQTAGVMVAMEKVLMREAPDLVVGDVNSTLAATLVAAKAPVPVPVAHVEAGLRSFDLGMPEEINRMVTDRLSVLLLTPSRDADENLKNEGVPAERIHFVGNVMIDTLLKHRPQAPWPRVRKALGLAERGYAVLTLHRPANVDAPGRLATILGRLAPVTARYPVIFPVHPRTMRGLVETGGAAPGLRAVEPMGYLDFLALMDHAALVLTDSGGIQEETTVLGVPCFTLRDNTERPVTPSVGTNTLVGADARGLAEALGTLDGGVGKRGAIPEGWDGRAGVRVAATLGAFLDLGPGGS